MRRLAIVHHRHQDWLPALQEAEPRLEMRGFHPSETLDAAWLAETEALFCWRLPAGLISLMPKLSWVQNSGAGVDHLLSNPQLPAHIPVTRADGQFGFWMARYTLVHLLLTAQRIEECRQAQHQRAWSPKLLPEDLTDKSALIFGFGRIGRQIGKALQATGMRVTGVARSAHSDPDFEIITSTRASELLGVTRVLVLAAPLTPLTRGIIKADFLRHGHTQLTLINVGRGELVVIPDLLAALDGGRVGHAVLDVFDAEPLPAESPLWVHPQVTVTPHHSGPSTPRQLIADILHNLRAYAEYQPITGAVDRSRGY